METETKTRFVTVQTSEGGLLLKREDLAGIVQQAYDEHGILAEPSYDTEAAAAIGRVEL